MKQAGKKIYVMKSAGSKIRYMKTLGRLFNLQSLCFFYMAIIRTLPSKVRWEGPKYNVLSMEPGVLWAFSQHHLILPVFSSSLLLCLVPSSSISGALGYWGFPAQGLLCQMLSTETNVMLEMVSRESAQEQFRWQPVDSRSWDRMFRI